MNKLVQIGALCVDKLCWNTYVPARARHNEEVVDFSLFTHGYSHVGVPLLLCEPQPKPRVRTAWGSALESGFTP